MDSKTLALEIEHGVQSFSFGKWDSKTLALEIEHGVQSFSFGNKASLRFEYPKYFWECALYPKDLCLTISKESKIYLGRQLSKESVINLGHQKNLVNWGPY
jgi:hypothetical protein